MPKVHHVAICCTDVDTSLRFWRDGIGLTDTMDTAFDGDWQSLFGVDSGRLRSVFLGDPTDATAGIVELVDFATPAHATEPVPAPPRGFFLVSLNVALDVTLARLAELGVGGDPRRIKAYGMGMAVVRDPDGVQVELIDLPDGAPIQVLRHLSSAVRWTSLRPETHRRARGPSETPLFRSTGEALRLTPSPRSVGPPGTVADRTCAPPCAVRTALRKWCPWKKFSRRPWVPDRSRSG